MIALALLSLLSGAAAGGEPVAVRAARHPGFGRLVFEWPRAIEVESRRSADQLVLRFARTFADLGAIAGRLDGYLLELAAGSDEREVGGGWRPGLAPSSRSTTAGPWWST